MPEPQRDVRTTPAEAITFPGKAVWAVAVALLALAVPVSSLAYHAGELVELVRTTVNRVGRVEDEQTVLRRDVDRLKNRDELFHAGGK